MISKLLGWLAGSKVGGAFGKVRDFMNGNKSYALGSVTIAQGLAGLWTKIAACGDLAAFIDMVSKLKNDTDWMMVLAGWGIIAAKSAISKALPGGVTGVK